MRAKSSLVAVAALASCMFAGLLYAQRVSAQAPSAGDRAGAADPAPAVAGRPATPAPAPDKESVMDIIKVSGVLVWPLMLTSVAGVALVFYLLFVLREEQVVPAGLRRDLESRLRSGSLDEIAGACGGQASPLASVTLAAVGAMRAQAGPDAVKEAAQSEGMRQAEAMQGPTRYLMDIASVATMLGILGTVLGMLEAFRSVEISETLARPTLLAKGVRQALYTTAEGLAIAIPATVAYALLRERAASLTTRLEKASEGILAQLLRRKF